MKKLSKYIQDKIYILFKNRGMRRRRKYFKKGQKFFSTLIKRDLVELEQFVSIINLKSMPNDIYHYYWLKGIEYEYHKFIGDGNFLSVL